jgi:hypothetical protein
MILRLAMFPCPMGNRGVASGGDSPTTQNLLPRMSPNLEGLQYRFNESSRILYRICSNKFLNANCPFRASRRLFFKIMNLRVVRRLRLTLRCARTRAQRGGRGAAPRAARLVLARPAWWRTPAGAGTCRCRCRCRFTDADARIVVRIQYCISYEYIYYEWCDLGLPSVVERTGTRP